MTLTTDKRCGLCGLQKEEAGGFFVCPHCDRPCHRATKFAPCLLCQKIEKREEKP